jgi:anti-sigma28 factor (negative regulator of flagellin synthesis)
VFPAGSTLASAEHERDIPSFDRQKVERLRMALRDGSFAIDARLIAACVLPEL